jgi:hypothetical protein
VDSKRQPAPGQLHVHRNTLRLSERTFWWAFYISAGLFILWLLVSGCAMNIGSGSASADASEEEETHGTNRISKIKIGK